MCSGPVHGVGFREFGCRGGRAWGADPSVRTRVKLDGGPRFGKPWFGWLQVRLLFVPGFRSETDVKFGPKRTITYHNRSLKGPPYVVEVGYYNSRASFSC